MMPDFFETLKQGFGKGVSAVSIKSKEMFDSNRVKSQIADIERQKKDALAELGTSVCRMVDSGRIDEEVLRTARTLIAGLDQQISERQQELAQIHVDAQEALGTTQVATGSQQPPAASQGAHCTSCGASVAPDVKFCGSCGSKI
jgi:hypothetical protein